MDLLNLLLSRRSIRRYTESPIPQRALETILAAGLLSPSSRGRRPWEFVVVQNPKTLEALSHCRQGSAAMLAGAKAAILVGMALPLHIPTNYFMDPLQSAGRLGREEADFPLQNPWGVAIIK